MEELDDDSLAPDDGFFHRFDAIVKKERKKSGRAPMNQASSHIANAS